MGQNIGPVVQPLHKTSLINDANLVSYWRFKDNANDSKGTNHGTSTSVAFSPEYGKFGNYGQGVKCNGINTKIDVSNSGTFNFAHNNYSVSFWINPITMQVSGNFIQMGNHVTGGKFWEIGTNGTNYIFIQIYNNGYKVQAYGYGSGIINSKWNHGVITFDGTSTNIYLNGVLILVNTQSYISDDMPSNETLRIGYGYDNNVSGGYYYNLCYLDDISIFSRALTASEVLLLATSCENKELYTTNFINDENLVAYWRFEGNSNATVSSFNGTDTNITYGTGYGKFGQGCLFAGNNSTSKIDFGAKIIPKGAKTISIWLKYLDGGSYYAILDETGTDSANYGNWWYCNSSFFYASAKYGVAGQNNFYMTSIKKVGDNVWHHICLTWDGTTNTNKVKLYIDGELDHSKTAAVTESNNPTYNTWLGRYHDNAQWTFNGSLDDFAVFNRALTAREVKKLYRQVTSIFL